MENLIAVYTAKEIIEGTNKPVIVSGWSWLKKESQAIERCKKKLSGPTAQLTHVWVCDWKKSPSVYKQILGDDKSEPILDMAINLRSSHLKKKIQPRPLSPRKQLAIDLRQHHTATVTPTVKQATTENWTLIKAKSA